MKIDKTVDRSSKEKLYVQIYAIFLDKIESGEWAAGAQIPPEDELCRIYDVSKVTVREAIQELVREGYLKRLQGKGTFVIYSLLHLGIVMRTRLSENDLYGEEVKVEKQIVERGIREATDEVKGFLMTEEAIYHIRHKKVIENESYHEEFFIPLFLLPDIDGEDVSGRSLYDLIEEKGAKKIFKVQQTIEITKVSEDTAAVLAIKEGSPAIQISRILIGLDGSPIAYSRLVGGGGKHTFHMEFERIK